MATDSGTGAGLAARVQHDLKCWPEYFEAVADGRKTFEIRINDRGFKVGDVLVLNEFDPGTQRFTGRTMRRRVVYLTTFEMQHGFVCMGLEHPEQGARLAALEAERDRLAQRNATQAVTIQQKREAWAAEKATADRLRQERDKALADMDHLWKSDHLWSAAYSAVEESATELWKQAGFPGHWEYPMQVAEMHRDRADRLRQALQQYGQHKDWCQYRYCVTCGGTRESHEEGPITQHGFRQSDCACGLAAVQAGEGDGR